MQTFGERAEKSGVGLESGLGGEERRGICGSPGSGEQVEDLEQ